jgi:hypothetical protein
VAGAVLGRLPSNQTQRLGPYPAACQAMKHSGWGRTRPPAKQLNTWLGPYSDRLPTRTIPFSKDMLSAKAWKSFTFLKTERNP